MENSCENEDKASSHVEISDLRTMLQKFNEELGVYINDDRRNRLGKVLTIVDASIADPEQRKAVKDLIQSGWWTTDMKISEKFMGDPHTDIRGVCNALGFELYPMNGDLPEPVDESDRKKKHTAEKYSKLVK